MHSSSEDSLHYNRLNNKHKNILEELQILHVLQKYFTFFSLVYKKIVSNKGMATKVQGPNSTFP